MTDDILSAAIVGQTVTKHFLLLGLILGTAAGCAAPRAELCPPPPPPKPGARGVIFSIDGAGDYHASSEALRHAVDEAGLPLDVETISWSHGRGRVLADQVDYDHAWAEGRRLADRVCAYRQRCSNGAVFLIAHSAGSAVALAAAENLPPDGIDRIVLLAPSVSSGYDLRRALQTTRHGIDVFPSERDVWALGAGIALAGTADREPGPAAGRVGFAPTIVTAQDAALYARLRQHPWDPCLTWTGNEGGHYGAYQGRYLRAYVMPLFRECGFQ